MIEIQRIRERKEEVLEGLLKRNIDATKEVTQILTLDQEWRSQKTALQNLEAELNTISKKIGQLFSKGKQAAASFDGLVPFSSMISFADSSLPLGTSVVQTLGSENSKDCMLFSNSSSIFFTA